MAARVTKAKTPMNFASMLRTDVPQGRNGKHKAIVTRILSDLDQMEPGSAIKVPLAQLSESKEKVRSALNRATRKNGHDVATVAAPVSSTWRVRSALIRVPRFSSIHMWPPPAPQQNVSLPDFSISVIDTPAAPSTSRGAAMMLLYRAR